MSHPLDGMTPMSAKQGWLTATVVLGSIAAIWNLGSIVELARKLNQTTSETMPVRGR